MVARVLVSDAALADLDAARRWLTQPGTGPRAAERLWRVAVALRDLGRHPLRWPEGEHPGVRERQVEGYRILYRVAAAPDNSGVIAGDVLVARVFGPGQDRRRL